MCKKKKPNQKTADPLPNKTILIFRQCYLHTSSLKFPRHCADAAKIKTVAPIVHINLNIPAVTC